LKKPAGSVRFRFYKQKTEPNRNRQKTEKKPSQTGKIEPNRKNRAKTEKTKPNRFEPVFALKKPNRTETGRFDPVSVFFQKKKFDLVTFFNKNRTETKMINPNLGVILKSYMGQCTTLKQ
jgi:hypothetical protein